MTTSNFPCCSLAAVRGNYLLFQQHAKRVTRLPSCVWAVHAQPVAMSVCAYACLPTKPFGCVIANESNALVIPGRGNGGKVLFAAIDDHFVDFANVDGLYCFVLDNLPNDTSVSSTDDANVRRLLVRHQHWVGHHLLVGSLVALRQLYHTIKEQYISKRLACGQK